jgi:hypothetical protein
MHKSVNTPLSHERTWLAVCSGWGVNRLMPHPTSQVRTTSRSWDKGVLTDLCRTGVLTDLCLTGVLTYLCLTGVLTDLCLTGVLTNLCLTRYMVVSRDQNAGRSHSMKTDNSSFESVEELKYLGTTLTNQNSTREEIRS